MEIFACLLSLRARADYHLGFLKEGASVAHVHFSPFVVCERKVGPPTAVASPAPAAAAAEKGWYRSQYIS